MSTQEYNKQFQEENKERIRARKHEYYLKNCETIKQKSREHYHRNADKRRAQMRQRWHEHPDEYKQWYQENRERVCQRNKERYHKNKEMCLATTKKWIQEHHEEIAQKRHQARIENRIARDICPAFKFLNNIRLNNIELFTTKFKVHTNLGHMAAKKCLAIQQNDYTLCPIYNDCTISATRMRCVCPMPHAFEFENAVSEIRKHAAEMVLANQK